jgi:outer membrane receptor for ferrienterochelin and colicins
MKKSLLIYAFLNITVLSAQVKDTIPPERKSEALEEVVISGTLKPVSRLETPVPVEIYTTTFLKKNPTSNVFEALQNVNGVRPQLNCNICNTGDIHINGLEGPYTMVTIDGMPIVSALSTVYGLSGIPNSLIDRIEIIKGPASSLSSPKKPKTHHCLPRIFSRLLGWKTISI